MVKFDELLSMSNEEVARHRSMTDHTGGSNYMRADAVLRLREVEAVIQAAQETQRYARFTFWVAVCTAATALGTLAVAFFSGICF